MYVLSDADVANILLGVSRACVSEKDYYEKLDINIGRLDFVVEIDLAHKNDSVLLDLSVAMRKKNKNGLVEVCSTSVVTAGVPDIKQDKYTVVLSNKSADEPTTKMNTWFASNNSATADFITNELWKSQPSGLSSMIKNSMKLLDQVEIWVIGHYSKNNIG